jgi:4'-phosphopantetheinyl transferase
MSSDQARIQNRMEPIDRGEVHVWQIDTFAAAAELARFQDYLSSDELRRAANFLFQSDQVRFTVTRGILRYLLANYSNVSPQAIEFEYNNFGKPELGRSTEAHLQFNVAHSAELAMLAISLGTPVGIDIEQIVCRDVSRLAKHLFAKEDHARFVSLPYKDQLTAFFCAWTRKEAVIKGIGRGLAIPLTSFDVCFIPGSAPALTTVRFDDLATTWSLFEIEADPGYAAALAVPSNAYRIRQFKWVNTM